MENKIWKAKRYLRISKEDADKSGARNCINAIPQESDSIVSQRALIDDFVKGRTDIELCGERCDDGFSGVRFDRPDFNALMDDIRDGSIDCIIVKDLSRFGRNHIDAGNYIENLFPLLGVRFIAINDGIDTIHPQTASDSILIPFKNLVNDAYCRDISIKIRSQFAVKRNRGQFVGAFAAYGYRKDEADKNKLVIDTDVADYVREIFRLKLSGMSADSIASRLNAMGVPSPFEYKRLTGANYVTNFKTGMEAKWSATAVLRILKNPIYVGTLVQGREGTPNHKIRQKKMKPQEEWAVVENCHEAIISLDTFENVQKAMRLDTRTAPNEDVVYLFSGILSCGTCGCTMTRKTVPAGGKKYIYYVCSGGKKKSGCTAKGVREDRLTEAVFVTVKNRIEQTLEMDRLLSFVDTAAFSKIRVQKLRRQLEHKQADIERCQRFKKGLYETLMDGVVSKADYDLFYADYVQEQEGATQQAEVLQREIETILSGTDEYGIWLERFKKRRNLTELTRPVVLELIDHIFVYGKDVVDIGFHYQSEYDKLLAYLTDLSKKQEVV